MITIYWQLYYNVVIFIYTPAWWNKNYFPKKYGSQMKARNDFIYTSQKLNQNSLQFTGTQKMKVHKTFKKFQQCHACALPGEDRNSMCFKTKYLSRIQSLSSSSSLLILSTAPSQYSDTCFMVSLHSSANSGTLMTKWNYMFVSQCLL